MDSQFQETKTFNDRGFKRDLGNRHNNDKRFTFGLIVVGVGALMMLYNFMPRFDFDLSWPIILIIIGLLIGIKSKFKRNGWWIMVLIGAANLFHPFKIFGVWTTDLVWPAVVMLIGLVIIFRKSEKKKWDHHNIEMVTNEESTVNIDVTIYWIN